MFLAIPGIFAQTFSETPGVEFIANSCTADNRFPVTVTGVGILTPTNALASVSVDITHTDNEDLDISLRSPGGTVIELSTDNGGTSNNYTGTNFEDAGADGPITSGTGPFTGTYIPEQPLATFVGEDADGDWVLQVCDDNVTGTLNSLTGTLNSFSLTFGVPCVPADASVSAPMLNCPATNVSIDVVIADLGSAASLVISNSANATVVPAPTATTYPLTGFMFGDGTVTITVADAADPTCSTIFDVEIPAACPPDNDLCDSAAPIACGDIDVAGTTTGASNNAPGICGNAGDGGINGVWYTVDGDGSDMTVTVNADPGNADDLNDSQVAVYSGDCTTLVCVGGNDDSTPPGSNGSQYSFTSEVGTTYYIYVDGFDGNDVGDFLISLECASCGADAVVLPPAGTAASISATTSCEDGAWTYYEDPANTGAYIFAIEWGANNDTPKAAASVTIDVQTDVFEAAGNAAGEASVAMGRYWNVDLGATTLVDPVNIKFYYDPQEISDVNAAVANYGVPNGFEWYKNNDGADYTHAGYVTSADFTSNVLILTPAATGTENGVDFVQFDGIASFSGGSGAAGTGGGFLPVELLSFEGKAMEEVNMLTWATATEENTEWHIIERSLDGRTNWTEVGRVAAAGYANTTQHYELKDKSPIANAYYRLISLDYDLYMDYSEVINIKRDVASGDIRVYPNPVNQQLKIDFALVQAEDVTINITDVTGKLISTNIYQGARGNNNHTVNFNGLSNGVYFVSMISDAHKVTKRVIKN